jgi:hypothetical protein
VPEQLEIQPGRIGAFVDGGVSMAKNPSLLLFLVATLSGFPFHWPIGEDRLLLVSVGTGVWRRDDDFKRVMNENLWSWAHDVPAMLMEDASWQNQLLLQYLSRSQTAWQIDGEIDDLSSDLLFHEPALSYLRYDVWLDPDGLRELGFADLVQSAPLRRIDGVAGLRTLIRIGEEAALRQVRDKHFPQVFDLPRSAAEFPRMDGQGT